MLTHSIKRKVLAVTLLDTIKKKLFDDPLPSRHSVVQQQQPVHPTQRSPSSIVMGKQGYTMFVENVKRDYKKGDLVCWSWIDSSDNSKSVPAYFIVTDFDELHYSCPYDEYYKQPECIMMRSGLTDGWQRAAPKRIRKLTERETQLVNLLNQKAQGHA